MLFVNELILMITIRKFRPTEAEYEGITAVEYAIFPDNPTTLAEFKPMDATLDPAYYYQRLVAEETVS